MPQEYTPSGSSQAYTIPAYSDVIDGVVAFRSFADDAAASVADKMGRSNAQVTTASTSLGVVRNIHMSTGTPSAGDGMDGDVWITYV